MGRFPLLDLCSAEEKHFLQRLFPQPGIYQMLEGFNFQASAPERPSLAGQHFGGKVINLIMKAAGLGREVVSEDTLKSSWLKSREPSVVLTSLSSQLCWGWLITQLSVVLLKSHLFPVKPQRSEDGVTGVQKMEGDFWGNRRTEPIHPYN